MKIEELLDSSAILFEFEAESKDDALKNLAKHFSAIYTDVSSRSLLNILRKREQLGSTGIGGGVAIPHARSDKMTKPVSMLAISRKGVEFQALDGEPVYIFFLIVDPQQPVGDHLKALAKIAKLLRDKFVRDSILRADSTVRVMEILQLEDARA
ncbi:MAG: PTS sugar transporter subunit IIA [Candidatus Omnitrophica bacterium]|nr:PTS sugar transporter subunit IIA [Candidatus Omnitrophota bacterium]